MALVEAEVVPYALPFREPYVTARGTLERREMVLLRVRTDDGLVGLGEAVPMSLRGGDSLDEVVTQLQDVAELLVESGDWATGDSHAPDQSAWSGLCAPAACAVVTARLDLASRERGLPAWRMLGAITAEPVECNGSLTLGEPAAVAGQAEGWAAEGFRTFKLKVGTGDPAEMIGAVRATLGDEARIRIDANGAWDVKAAGAALAQMEPLGIELVEEPTSSLAGMAKLRKLTEIPIAADESVAGIADAARAVELEACELATVKLSKVGGHLDALAIAEELPVYLSSALDGPVGIAAAAHTAQALRHRDLDAHVAHGLATQRLFDGDIADVRCELQDGRLHLPDGPGLGVQLDEQALARHSL